MNDEQLGTERITLSRSAIRQREREAQARGYARGRHDGHMETLRRLDGRCVGEGEFVREATARPADSLALVWNVLQAALPETGGESR